MTRLPYVTLLLRLRGNTDVERARWRVAVRSTRGGDLLLGGPRRGSLRTDIDPAVVARLLFGMINSIVEWYRPTARRRADQLADDCRSTIAPRRALHRRSPLTCGLVEGFGHAASARRRWRPSRRAGS